MNSGINWLGVILGTLPYMAQRPGHQENWSGSIWKAFKMWYWRRMEKIKWSEKVTNEQDLDRIGENRTLVNNILCRKANWIGHILRRNSLLHDAIEGQMTEMKGVGRRRTRLLDDLRNRRIYWELKEEAEDRRRWI